MGKWKKTLSGYHQLTRWLHPKQSREPILKPKLSENTPFSNTNGLGFWNIYKLGVFGYCQRVPGFFTVTVIIFISLRPRRRRTRPSSYPPGTAAPVNYRPIKINSRGRTRDARGLRGTRVFRAITAVRPHAAHDGNYSSVRIELTPRRDPPPPAPGPGLERRPTRRTDASVLLYRKYIFLCWRFCGMRT